MPKTAHSIERAVVMLNTLAFGASVPSGGLQRSWRARGCWWVAAQLKSAPAFEARVPVGARVSAGARVPIGVSVRAIMR
jgi:hypothetical protein